MTAFNVDPAVLLKAVDRMAAFDSELEAHLTQAANAVTRLGTSWYGDGGEAERAAQARWDEGAREMRETLARLRSIAEHAHDNYASAARTNTRMWG